MLESEKERRVNLREEFKSFPGNFVLLLQGLLYFLLEDSANLPKIKEYVKNSFKVLRFLVKEENADPSLRNLIDAFLIIKRDDENTIRVFIPEKYDAWKDRLVRLMSCVENYNGLEDDTKFIKMKEHVEWLATQLLLVSLDNEGLARLAKQINPEISLTELRARRRYARHSVHTFCINNLPKEHPAEHSTERSVLVLRLL